MIINISKPKAVNESQWHRVFAIWQVVETDQYRGIAICEWIERKRHGSYGGDWFEYRFID